MHAPFHIPCLPYFEVTDYQKGQASCWDSEAGPANSEQSFKICSGRTIIYTNLPGTAVPEMYLDNRSQPISSFPFPGRITKRWWPPCCVSLTSPSSPFTHYRTISCNSPIRGWKIQMEWPDSTLALTFKGQVSLYHK